MRRVARSDADRPAMLDPESGRAADETRKNVAAAAAGADFTFTVYKHRDIKVVFHRLFHGKCAYCESRYVAATPMDVEHYRPKSSVQAWGDHPAAGGYYWLAADWDNLLPSCADCNRRREQFDLTDGADGPKLGKQAIFPVADETKRWAAPDAANEEQPLLLHPTVDDDVESLLRFREDGFVEAAPALAGLDAARVDTSILVYGLNRPGLVLERLAQVKLLQHKMAVIDKVVEIIDAAHGDQATLDLAEDLLQFLLADLRTFQEPHRPYSTAARQLTEAFIARFERAQRQ